MLARRPVDPADIYEPLPGCQQKLFPDTPGAQAGAFRSIAVGDMCGKNLVCQSHQFLLVSAAMKSLASALVLCLAAAIPARSQSAGEDAALLPDASDAPGASAGQGAPPAVPPGRTAAPQPEETATISPPRVSIVTPTVTVDGASRPDLGQSLSDTLAARLIRTGEVEVVDLTFGLPTRSSTSSAGGSSLPLIAPDGSSAAALAGPDYLIVPTIIGEKGFFRVTMRKQDAHSGKVETILQETLKGDTASLYKLLEQMAVKLVPKKAPRRRYDYVKMWLSPPSTAKPEPEFTAPKALGRLSPEKAAAIEALKAQADLMAAQQSDPIPAGQIQSVNLQWSFAVVGGMREPALREGDQVMAWSEANPGAVHTLKVTAVYGTTVVADIPAGATLAPGDKVYRWQMPVEIRPAQ